MEDWNFIFGGRCGYSGGKVRWARKNPPTNTHRPNQHDRTSLALPCLEILPQPPIPVATNACPRR